MRGFEEMTIMGNAGGDAEMRYLPNGTPVTSFSVAVNLKRSDGKGGTLERTKWYRVTCFKQLAEFAAQYVKKGTGIWARGPLDARPYETKAGDTQVSLDLTARDLQLLGGGGTPAIAGDSEPF